MKLKLLLPALLFSFNVIAQEHSSTCNPDSCTHPLSRTENMRYKTKFPRAFIIPAICIGAGLSCIKANGLYSSIDARNDIQRLTKGRGSKIDDYLIFSPYVEFAALQALKFKCRNDFINTSILILKSEIIMAAIVFPMKKFTQVERPYSYFSGKPEIEKDKNSDAFHSLPSGHTAQAFVAAAIVHKEFRYKSQWPGVAAYGLATTVAAYRMINDRHWLSDVLTGAGIGMLSANIAYGTHRFKWGKKQICVLPTQTKDMTGFAMMATF
jgi:membrane-associated phospholipid phosphatase